MRILVIYEQSNHSFLSYVKFKGPEQGLFFAQPLAATLNTHAETIALKRKQFIHLNSNTEVKPARRVR